jgi:metal-sulfur cluster biosynthetic enzyme
MAPTTDTQQIENPQSILIRDALREVMDPELGMNVVELGLIRNINIDTDSVKISMILTTPFCPYGPALIESVRTTAEQASDAPISVEMGTEMWNPEMIEEGAGGDWGLF